MRGKPIGKPWLLMKGLEELGLAGQHGQDFDPLVVKEVFVELASFIEKLMVRGYLYFTPEEIVALNTVYGALKFAGLKPFKD